MTRLQYMNRYHKPATVLVSFSVSLKIVSKNGSSRNLTFMDRVTLVVSFPRRLHVAHGSARGGAAGNDGKGE